MGTSCEIQLFAKNPKHARHIFATVINDVQRLEAKYSRYRQDSFLSAINRTAQQSGSIAVDEETAGLLNYADTCYKQSDGLFDISSGILRKAWNFHNSQLPSQELITKLLEKVGWHKLNWNSPILEFPIPGMELDFGGIVKEYAVDRAAELCRQAGSEHGLINLGGDLKIIGPRTDKQPWQIGIKHPRQTHATLTTLAINHGAIAGSGDYERCIKIQDMHYGHILNPRTGWPVRHMAAVTVLSDFCVVAGSAATIAMLKEEKGPQWLQDMQLPHLWIDTNGQSGGVFKLKTDDHHEPI
ncbi:MAG: thiamine biosynthesis protein ApbE [Methylomonas sp.]|nr:MAG: thiamine biosynthesis protein ApbE [Methylomonas sp.]